MALAERRISSEATKTAVKPKQTAKSLPVEPPAANSQAPTVVKLKIKKTAKKAVPIPIPETEAPAIAVEPPLAAPVEEPVVTASAVEAPEVETPVAETPKVNKYAATKCHFCEKGLLNYFSLIRHVKCCPKNPENRKETVAPPMPSPTKEDSQTVDVVKSCPLCNEVFSSSKLLERHASSCCESPTEIGNRKKLFRRRPSEVSVSSKKSEPESVNSSVSNVSKSGKRRKKGKSKPFYLKKKLMYKAKMNPLTLQMLTKKFDVQDMPEKSKEAKEKVTKKKYSKRKSELENLALPIISAKDETQTEEAEENPKKEVLKKSKKSSTKEDVVKEDQTIEAQLAHLAPEKPVVPTEPSVSEAKQNSEKVASSVDGVKQKKIIPKASKKSATSVEPSKSEVEARTSDDNKRKRKSEPEKETPVTEAVKKGKKEEQVEKKKLSVKPNEEKKKAKKSTAEAQPALPQAVPKEKTAEKEKDLQPDELSKKSKSKSKKSDISSKSQVEPSPPKHDDDEELPLSQIMKLKKAKKTSEAPEQKQIDEVVSSAEPSLPEPAAEPVKPKKDKKSVGKAVESKLEPVKKKAKIEETQTEKTPSEESQSDDSPSPKKKRGRRSDEKEPHSTFCKVGPDQFLLLFQEWLL